MAISYAEVSGLLQAYLTRYPDEAERVAALSEAVDRGDELTSRKTLPGHVTTGAFLLDGEGRLLQIAHKALERWLNPGGHCEPDDASLPDAALRELLEETGIAADAVRLADRAPLDVDVHAIPANPRKGEPEHWHYDFRFVFLLTGVASVELQADEVDGHRWVPLADAQLGAAEAKLAAVARGLQPQAQTQTQDV